MQTFCLESKLSKTHVPLLFLTGGLPQKLHWVKYRARISRVQEDSRGTKYGNCIMQCLGAEAKVWADRGQEDGGK